MNSSQINWGLVSAILIFVSGFPYMWAIYKRTLERPVISTWVLWLAIGVLIFTTSYQAGVNWDTTLYPLLMAVVNPAIIVVLSLQYGQISWNRFDTSCVVICVITVVVWKLTDSPVLGIVGGIVADFVAALPQIKKNWKEPSDEPLFPWAMFAIASLVGLKAIAKWDVSNALVPLYMLVASSVGLTLPLLLHRLKIKKS